MSVGNLSLKIGFDGSGALSGVNNLITKFAILRSSALQIVDTFGVLSKATIGEGVALKNLGDFTNLNVKNLQKLELFAEKLGVSSDKVRGKISGLNEELRKIEFGGSSALTGIATTYGIDISSFDAEQVLGEISKKYNQYIKQGRTDLAQNMINALGMGEISPLLRRYDEAMEYSIPTLDSEQIENLSKLNEGIREFWQIITQSQKGIFADWADTISSGLGKINNALKGFDKETLGYLSSFGGVLLGAGALKGGISVLKAGASGVGALGSIALSATKLTAVIGSAYLSWKAGQWIGEKIVPSNMQEKSEWVKSKYNEIRENPSLANVLARSFIIPGHGFGEDLFDDRNLQNLSDSSGNVVNNYNNEQIIVVDKNGNVIGYGDDALNADHQNLISNISNTIGAGVE